MKPDKIAAMLGELRVLKFFPDDEFAMLPIMRLVSTMCETEEHVRWLIDRMTSGLYTEWPGLREMRACYCSKFKPQDGINAYSEVYLDGIPSERKSNLPIGIEAPDLKQLAQGNEAQMAPIPAEVKFMVGEMSKRQKSFAGPTTQAEIDAAPEWLKKLEGFE